MLLKILSVKMAETFGSFKKSSYLCSVELKIKDMKKNSKPIKKDRHRKGYYREYNLMHPERLKRVGLLRVRDPKDTYEGLGEEGDSFGCTLDPDMYDDVLRNIEDWD